MSEVALDVICYALGLRYLGRAFLPHALAATGCFALFYAVNERVGYTLPDLGGMPLVAAGGGRRVCRRGRRSGGYARAARRAATTRWRWFSPKSWAGSFPQRTLRRI